MNQAQAKEIHALPSVDPISWNDGVRIGKIASVDTEGRILIDYPGNALGPIPAMLCASVMEKVRSGADESGTRIVLLFEENDPSKPIIVDILADKIEPLAEKTSLSLDIDPEQDCTIDGKNIQFNAENQIVLKCGKASITLTRAGKVLIRGAYLLNRSSGANRIRGASVHVN